jgi:hypothetical protein
VLFLDTDERFKAAPEETFIWVVTKSDVHWVRSDLGTRALEREVAALRCGLDYDGTWGAETSRCPELLKTNYTEMDHLQGRPLPFDTARAHALYTALLGQVEAIIKGKQLLIVPSGALTQLPFQALVTNLPAGAVAGEIQREVGQLGVRIGPISDEDRRRLPADVLGGVRIVNLTPAGPAEQAGLRAGDILLAVDQQSFAAVPEAIAAIQAAGPASKVSLKLVRNGQRIDLAVTLGTLIVKDWTTLLLDITSAQQTAWLIRDHAITVLPSVSSLKALRQLAKESHASRSLIGFGNPLLDGPDPRYVALATAARSKTSCPGLPKQRVATLTGKRRGVLPVSLRSGLADGGEIRSQVPLPETADELCAVAHDLGASDKDIWLGNRATEAEIKRLSEAGELAKYRIVERRAILTPFRG